LSNTLLDPKNVSAVVSEGEVIEDIIGRGDLLVRLRPIGAYTPVGIIDMGLGVKVLRLGHPGRGSGFHFP
jgi:hypothetical protein